MQLLLCIQKIIKTFSNQFLLIITTTIYKITDLIQPYLVCPVKMSNGKVFNCFFILLNRQADSDK